MEVIKQAVVNKFKELTGGVHNSLYTLVDGQLYFDRAKQKALLPYLVYNIIDGLPEYNFCSDFERLRIQFTIHSENESSTEAGAIYEALKSVYDWCVLSIVGYDHVYMRRVLFKELRDSTHNTWQITVDYEIFVEAT